MYAQIQNRKCQKNIRIQKAKNYKGFKNEGEITS